MKDLAVSNFRQEPERVLSFPCPPWYVEWLTGVQPNKKTGWAGLGRREQRARQFYQAPGLRPGTRWSELLLVLLAAPGEGSEGAPGAGTAAPSCWVTQVFGCNLDKTDPPTFPLFLPPFKSRLPPFWLTCTYWFSPACLIFVTCFSLLNSLLCLCLFELVYLDYVNVLPDSNLWFSIRMISIGAILPSGFPFLGCLLAALTIIYSPGTSLCWLLGQDYKLTQCFCLPCNTLCSSSYW